MTDRVSFPLSIAVVAMLSLTGPALSSTSTSEQNTFLNFTDIAGGALDLRGWSNLAAVGNHGGTVRLKVHPDPTNQGRGFVPGLDARVLVPMSGGWQFGDTYIAGEPVLSVVRSQSIKAFFRNEYRVSAIDEVAPYGKHIRLSFFRPAEWLGALDGASYNSVLNGNARGDRVSGIPLPGGGPLLAGALFCVLAARRWISRLS